MKDVDSARSELLVIRAMNGSHEAMSEIVRLWNPWMHAALSTWIDSQPDIDELAQVVWLEAWVSLGKLNEPRAFPGWLRQIAYRCASTHIRKKRKTDEPTLREEPSYSPSLAWIGTILSSLSPAQASVMKMHFAEGYSIDEIAATLQLPSGTVKSRIRLAKAILRRKLQD